MKYYIWHFYITDLKNIPGVYREGEAHYINIPDEEFKNRIHELVKRYDVLLRYREEDKECPVHIWLDQKGRCFRQR